MALNLGNLEAALQARVDALGSDSDEKTLLLLGKALEATFGRVTLWRIGEAEGVALVHLEMALAEHVDTLETATAARIAAFEALLSGLLVPGSGGLLRFVAGYREVEAPRSNTGAALTLTTANQQRHTVNANTTLTLPTPVETAGDVLTLVVDLQQDATGGRTVTWAAPAGQSIRWHGGAPPVISTGGGKINQFVATKRQADPWWTVALIFREG